MTAIIRSVMTARNTGAPTYAATDRQLAGFAAATFIPAEALVQITIRNRTLHDGLPARASPMPISGSAPPSSPDTTSVP